MFLIRYFHLDTASNGLASCLRHWICILSGPRLGHDYGKGHTCTRCDYFGLNL